MESNKLVDPIEQSLRQCQKTSQQTTSTGLAEARKIAPRAECLVKRWIFHTHDTVADRAHTTNKAIEQLMAKHYQPAHYSDADWWESERAEAIKGIVKLSQAWCELAELRLADFLHDKDDNDSTSTNLITYLDMQQEWARENLRIWKEVLDGREASRMISQYCSKAQGEG